MGNANLFLLTILYVLCMLKLLQGVRSASITSDEDALIALKAHITNDPENLIASNWSKGTPVCNWIGISCGVRHERVTEILLDGMNLTGTIPPHVGNLSFLVTLSLSGNRFSGSLPLQLANLRRLKVFDLGNNLVDGLIPSWIGSFVQLRHLDLSSNKFGGLIPTAICNLSQLNYLNLKENHLSGEIPKAIGNIYNMRMLDLSNNNLTGGVPAVLFNMSSLERLNISTNWLIGSIPTTFPKNLSSLSIMSFSKNNLTGRLPSNMFTHLPALEFLSLSLNLLSGPIPPSLFTCYKLRVISLSWNHFEGELHEGFGNFTFLKELKLSFNNFKAEIPKSFGNLVNLEVLHMRKTVVSGKIPSSLRNLTQLIFFTFQENKLEGSIPPLDVPNLLSLSFQSNNLEGTPPYWIFNSSMLQILDLTMNNLWGSLPLTLGLNLPSLRLFLIGGNNFDGPVPEYISNASKLTYIEMGSNKFFGSIPNSLGHLRNLQYLSFQENNLNNTSLMTFFSSLANCKYLKVLQLQENPFNSTLPTAIGNISSSIERFYIYGCRLRGNIPQEIGNLTSLTTLVLRDNELTGTIPFDVGKLSKLQEFQLDLNRIQGSIPSQLCGLQSLGSMWLSENMLSGKIPSCLGNLTSLRYLLLQSNRLKSTIPTTLWKLEDILELNMSSNSLSGSLPQEIRNLKVVIKLDFSGNRFSGSIPPIFKSLQSLIRVSFSNNTLEGSIPESFGDAVSLEFIDLSINNLSGEIPKSLEKLIYLKHLNVSFNALKGEIPNKGPFTNLSAQSFLGNKELCGAPKFNIYPCKTNNQKQPRVKKMILVAIGTTILSLGLVCIVRYCCKRKTSSVTHQEPSLPLATLQRISMHELSQATNKFDDLYLLGRGSFGSVYKAMMSNGMCIAAKVYNLEHEGAFKSFDMECEVLRRIRHRNLVKIIGSCCTTEFKALVMEFMPNWSLEKWLYSHNYFLDILQRLNIMIDVAAALEYLHHGSIEPIVHCDLKPSNILLDEDMVAHVTDFGVSKLFGKGQTVIQTVTLATIGYMAPEFGSEGLVTIKGDIYSLGILLMECFTRRKPTDEIFNEGMSMKRWVEESLSSGITQIADPNLMKVNERHYLAKSECISSIMELAVKCCADLVEGRINSKDAHQALKKIKHKFLNDVQQT